MNTESNSYLPEAWKKTAAVCAGEADFIENDKVPKETQGTPADIRRLLLVRHNGPGERHGGSIEKPIFWPAFYYLLDAHCSLDEILAVMDEHSRLKEPNFPEIEDIYGLSPAELKSLLESRLAPWYLLANRSLNNDETRGFNRHGLFDHISIVAKNTVQLLKDLGYSEEVQKIGLIMAYGHDLGNVLSRKFHSLVSPYIFEKYVPELKQDISKWVEIRQGIEFHNEPVIMKYLESRGDKTNFEGLSPAALALIVADKTHVGPIRVSDKVKDINALIEIDPHFVVNLLLNTKQSGIQSDGSFLWQLEFQPTLSTEEQQQSLERIKQDPYSNPAMTGKKFVPNWMHQAHREHNISHMASVDAQLWRLYIERNILAIRAIFELGKSVNVVRVLVTDSQNGGEIAATFTRDRKEELIQKKINECSQKI